MTSGVFQNGYTDELSQRKLAMIIDSFVAVLPDVVDESFDQDGTIIVIDQSGQVLFHYDLGRSTWSEHLKHLNWLGDSIGSNALTRCLLTQTSEVVVDRDHSHDLLQDMRSLASVIHVGSLGDEQTAVIGLFVPKVYDDHTASFLLKSLVYALKLELHQQMEKHTLREHNLRDIVFETVNLFHTKNDVDEVLSDAVESLLHMFPNIEIELYLSQDYHSSKLTVKPLMMDDRDQNICTQAFMAGTVKCETLEQGGTRLAVPLNGKQGVYGVFQLVFAPGGYQEAELEYILLLIDSAGSAFENAKLFEQSNALNGELRVINEITRRLNQSLQLKDIFTFASQELISIFDANYGCVLKLDDANDRFIVEASNLSTFTNEIISTDYGFSGIVYKTKEPLIISDYSLSSNVESKLMLKTDSRSLIATPIIVNASVVGAILVTHREPNFFTYENWKLLQVISVHIGLAIANASLHAEVRRMVITDNLTGLYSRSYLDEQITKMQKKDFCGALILVDVDDFKKINDTYGHQVGDQVLIQVGEIIKSSIRESDIAARWGGEELAIYLPLSKLEHTMKVAERIRISIYNETKPRVSVSCGLSLWSWEDETISVESLFYRADMALYKAKDEGRNNIVIG